jgi:hypothetical protein
MTVTTSQQPVKNVLARLRGVRQIGSGKWKALCPAHDDHSPSLSIRETAEGKVLLCCWAGCPTTEVLVALGLHWRDLFPCAVRSYWSSNDLKTASKETGIRELADRFDRACINAHRRLAVLYRTAGRIFATYGLEITNDEAWWIRDLPWLECVMEWLLSDDPEIKLAGLQACGRWLI